MGYFSFVEEALQSAIRATDALYSENVQALASLSADEVGKIFGSSSMAVGSADLILEPGTTILDMAMKAGCFRNLSTKSRKNFAFILNVNS